MKIYVIRHIDEDSHSFYERPCLRKETAIKHLKERMKSEKSFRKYHLDELIFEQINDISFTVKYKDGYVLDIFIIEEWKVEED